MNMPFYPTGLLPVIIHLLLALPIGMAFGFFLERGGLGNANKLAGQFYLRDLTVFKVMFTAIITAMTGIFILSGIGFLDQALLSLNPTYIAPQLLAGLLFGFGFILSGLCPGTAAVALSTGRLDGLFTLLGIFAGIFAFSEFFPIIKDFHYSTALGTVTLNQYFELPRPLVIVIVFALAGMGFLLAEWVENKQPVKEILAGFASSVLKSKAALTAITILLAIFIIAAMASPRHYNTDNYGNGAGTVKLGGKSFNTVGIHSLAESLMRRDRGMLVLDLVAEKTFEKHHIPGAINYDGESALSIPDEISRVIVYGYGKEIPPQLENLDSQELYLLPGGYESWKKNVLFPDLAYSSLSEKERKRLKRLSMYFGGHPYYRPEVSPSKAGFLREGC